MAKVAVPQIRRDTLAMTQERLIAAAREYTGDIDQTDAEALFALSVGAVRAYVAQGTDAADTLYGTLEAIQECLEEKSVLP